MTPLTATTLFRVLLACAALLGGAAHAHAYLEASTPAEGEVLSELPEAVTLRFTEPTEVNFSLYKVYPLEAEIDLSAENAQQRLSALAGQLVSEVLEARDDDEARADTGVQADGRVSAEVTLPLKEGLQAPHYVVMWRVLSIDTHTTQGFFTFSVLP
ncbi:copper resistance CopC family protein [Truepera radiovictrix]|uniref:Copper resistance protein CopC n=1 Tax=Truepera radiovictrix (strain DSM 17093 / CIP 108686 / LMG 22925 / RQ-24) TaxID=649638 RepID=D7CUL7_TRURR|nr:copper resistance protein CopC [Truepera radiovictrix]ADI14008.1 copper resistance protein CopC [Truepera radiovictrix DSM 17093]WMT57432.1 copper resistance protein CopC [Truepera radiovictrix]